MKKVKVLVLSFALIVISTIVIIANGKSYTIKIDNIAYDSNFNELEITIEDESVAKCVDKYYENGILNIHLESISKGHTYLEIKNSSTQVLALKSIYVHDFGIITIDEYMGDSSGSIIIPISFTIWLMYVLYLLIVSYKQSVKENLYQYKNIVYLGIIIFISFGIISQFISLFNYSGLINTIDGIISMFNIAQSFLPIVFCVSILIIISNILLIRKEGFNLTNILGIILGTCLCFFTILPEVMYQSLYSATWIDIHNQNGIELYIYNLVETIIFIVTTYIECVLIGTIIMGIKSARYIPKFDKDFIVILGCQIKKDGSLTNLLKGRVDRAIEFSKKQKEKVGKDILFIPSGGKGDDEVMAEAQAMKSYLLEKGIDEDSILVEDKSKNTYENIKFSYRLIKRRMENAKVAFSTTNYHVFRAGNIATKQGLNVEGIGATTKSYFWINAFIREFIATIFSEKKKHMIVVCSIILAAAFMIAVTYFNNNI